METNKKLKLLGSGNIDNWNYFVLSKDSCFFSLFPIFLIRCGITNIGIYEDYQEEIPDMNLFNNKIENYKNGKYDIDLIYSTNRIILIVRTDISNRDILIEGLNEIVDSE